MDPLRDQIDAIDAELVDLIAKRIEVARKIARIKKQEQLPILDGSREEAIKAKVRDLAKAEGISPHVMEEVLQLILDYSRIEMESV